MGALTPYLPIVIATVGTVAAMLLGAWGKRTAAVWTAVAALAAGALAAPYSVAVTSSAPAMGGTPVDAPITIACLALAAVVLAASSDTLRANDAGVRIAALSALAAVASVVIGTTHDLLILFLGVETLALLGYGLVAVADTPRARESAMKWFIQGSVSTALFIAGIAVLVGRAGGQTRFDAVLSTPIGATAAPTAMAIGLVLVIAALAFKAGAFPFHSWMPDAFESAPPAATAVLASAGKIGPLAALVTLSFAQMIVTGGQLTVLIAAIALGSVVFGNLAALRQRSLARMLAYSGIAQIGYALTGALMPEGLTSTLTFAVLYGITAAASFVFIVAVREARPDWDGSIAGLAGLSRTRPVLAVSLVAIMLSLTGIPLTAGFWGKYLVFTATLTSGYLWLAVVGMLASVVSFGYYGAVLRAAFMEDAAGETATDPDAIPATAAAVPTDANPARVATLGTAVLACAIVVIGVAPFLMGLGLLTRVFN